MLCNLPINGKMLVTRPMIRAAKAQTSDGDLNRFPGSPEPDLCRSRYDQPTAAHPCVTAYQQPYRAREYSSAEGVGTGP